MKKNSFLESFNNPILNIIFDLGGVIVNIDYNKTRKAFEALGVADFDKMYSQAAQTGIFDKFEIGLISPDEFRNGLRKMFTPLAKLTDKQIDDAWNAMLLDLPPQRLEVLRTLKKTHRLFLLSNTNQIHINFRRKTIDEAQLESYFEKFYLSHEIHLRKPNRNCYDFVVRQNNLNAAETLFIDDTQKNVDGALAAGLNAYLLKKGETICDLF